MFDFPAAPTNGQQFTPAGGPTYIWYAPVWQFKPPPAGGIIMQDFPPSPPQKPGQIWWETDTGNLFIWFDDGTSQQWVQLTGTITQPGPTPPPASLTDVIISDTPPVQPQPNGQVWYESTTGKHFIWYNDGNSQQWVEM